MLKSSFTHAAAMLLVTLPGIALAHPGHGSASALQHDWEHALWFGAAFTLLAWSVSMFRSRAKQARR